MENQKQVVPMPWQLKYGDGQVFDCSAFLFSGDDCDLKQDNIAPVKCDPSGAWLLFGDPGDSHNSKFCANHYFEGLGDGTQFDDYWLAPIGKAQDQKDETK